MSPEKEFRERCELNDIEIIAIASGLALTRKNGAMAIITLPHGIAFCGGMDGPRAVPPSERIPYVYQSAVARSSRGRFYGLNQFGSDERPLASPDSLMSWEAYLEKAKGKGCAWGDVEPPNQ